MTIRLHWKFEKKLSKLPRDVEKKFFERVKLFSEYKFHPLLNNHSVEKRYPGWRSINVTGDYRALYEDREEEIVFMKIGTHSELYG